jgi:hypothetical protein
MASPSRKGPMNRGAGSYGQWTRWATAVLVCGVACHEGLYVQGEPRRRGAGARR